MHVCCWQNTGSIHWWHSHFTKLEWCRCLVALLEVARKDLILLNLAKSIDEVVVVSPERHGAKVIIFSHSTLKQLNDNTYSFQQICIEVEWKAHKLKLDFQIFPWLLQLCLGTHSSAFLPYTFYCFGNYSQIWTSNFCCLWTLSQFFRCSCWRFLVILKVSASSNVNKDLQHQS